MDQPARRSASSRRPVTEATKPGPCPSQSQQKRTMAMSADTSTRSIDDLETAHQLLQEVVSL